MATSMNIIIEQYWGFPTRKGFKPNTVLNNQSSQRKWGSALSNMFTKGFLSEVRRQALRRRVWYRALDSVERGILSISANIIDSVKSDILNDQLSKIIVKLRDACKCRFVKHLEQHGLERVQVIQRQAYSFGYSAFKELSKDIGFIKYLMLIDFYQPVGWRIYST